MQRYQRLAGFFAGTAFSFLLSAAGLAAEEEAPAIVAKSGPGRVHLLELFTSEGCSSCPPAESWLSGLKQSPKLWKEVVPVAFHVDYWDKLGWKDELANRAATARQERYAAGWGAAGGGVYTPCFVLDGREWKAQALGAPGGGGSGKGGDDGEAGPGELTARLHPDGTVEVAFVRSGKSVGAVANLTVHVAILGIGGSTEVKAGENRGRTLVHDFAVMGQADAALDGKSGRAAVQVPKELLKHGRSALAVWVTEGGRQEAVQAAGIGI